MSQQINIFAHQNQIKNDLCNSSIVTFNKATSHNQKYPTMQRSHLFDCNGAQLFPRALRMRLRRKWHADIRNPVQHHRDAGKDDAAAPATIREHTYDVRSGWGKGVPKEDEVWEVA